MATHKKMDTKEYERQKAALENVKEKIRKRKEELEALPEFKEEQKFLKAMAQGLKEGFQALKEEDDGLFRGIWIYRVNGEVFKTTMRILGGKKFKTVEEYVSFLNKPQ